MSSAIARNSFVMMYPLRSQQSHLGLRSTSRSRLQGVPDRPAPERPATAFPDGPLPVNARAVK
jgi:hypothetical protein